MAPPRRNSGCSDSLDSSKSVTLPCSSRAQAPVGIKVHIMRQRRSLACSQGAAYAASKHAIASETFYQRLHEATEQHEAAQQHASQEEEEEELQQQQHIVPVCVYQGAAAVGLGCEATADAYAHLSSNAYAHSSSDLACAGSDSDSIIAGIEGGDNDDGSMFLSANHTDAELAEYLSSASLNTISPYNSGALLAGAATPPAPALSTRVSPFAAFASTANHAVADSGEWTIGTSAAPQPVLHRSSSRGNVVSTAAGDAATAAVHSENADVTDPLLIAAHAAISAACAAAPPCTTTSGADLHTLLSACNGGAVLLLGHGSTTISAQGAQLLSCASLDRVLQQHQAPCSICGVQDPLQGHPQGCGQELVPATADQQEPDEQLPQQQGAQRTRRMGMVLQPQQQITLQGLQRSRRMGMLVCRPVSSNSTGVQPAEATAVSQPTAAAASAAEDTSCSRSVIVLGVANSEAHPAAAAVPCCSAPAGQHRAAGAAVPTTAPHTVPAHRQQQQQQQQQQHGTPTPQPVMQLLSCSTLLSPCCSSTLLGSGNISCLRIGSINLSNLNALLGHTVPAQCSTASAAVAPVASAAAAAAGGGGGGGSGDLCSSAVLPSGAGGMLGQSQRMLVLKSCLGQQLQQLQEEQEQQAGQEEQQQFIYLLD